MTVNALTEATRMLPTAPHRHARLPLRAELYLIAHNDDTGRPYLHENTLAVGLAGALLLELWLARRVAPGWTYDLPTGGWRPAPGRITITNPTPVGDPLADAALATVAHTRHTTSAEGQLKTALRHLAVADLYQRVRANMLTVGVLRHTTRRRYGLARTDTHTPADSAWPVRARAQLRSLVHNHGRQARHAADHPDDQQVALAGLVDALELAPYLLAPDITIRRLRTIAHHLVGERDHAIEQILTTVDALRGDIAVTALSTGP